MRDQDAGRSAAISILAAAFPLARKDRPFLRVRYFANVVGWSSMILMHAGRVFASARATHELRPLVRRKSGTSDLRKPPQKHLHTCNVGVPTDDWPFGTETMKTRLKLTLVTMALLVWKGNTSKMSASEVSAVDLSSTIPTERDGTVKVSAPFCAEWSKTFLSPTST